MAEMKRSLFIFSCVKSHKMSSLTQPVSHWPPGARPPCFSRSLTAFSCDFFFSCGAELKPTSEFLAAQTGDLRFNRPVFLSPFSTLSQFVFCFLLNPWSRLICLRAFSWVCCTKEFLFASPVFVSLPNAQKI